jgi:hypothetical protein
LHSGLKTANGHALRKTTKFYSKGPPGDPDRKICVIHVKLYIINVGYKTSTTLTEDDGKQLRDPRNPDRVEVPVCDNTLPLPLQREVQKYDIVNREFRIEGNSGTNAVDRRSIR